MAEFDLVVRGGMVIDGTGTPAEGGDVAVRDGVIVVKKGAVVPSGTVVGE